MLAAAPGQSATVEVALAVIADSPRKRSVGYVRIVPPPAMAFITPAPAEEATRAAIWPAFMSARSERGSTLLDRHERPFGRPYVDLPGPGDLLLGVEKHLLPLGDPARSARDGEEHREGRRWHPDRLVDQAGV